MGKRGRAPGGKSPSSAPTCEGSVVTFERNNHRYRANVREMVQINESTGTRRSLRRKGSKWFFECSSKRRPAGHNSLDGNKWMSFSGELNRALEAAFRSCKDTPHQPEQVHTDVQPAIRVGGQVSVRRGGTKLRGQVESLDTLFIMVRFENGEKHKLHRTQVCAIETENQDDKDDEDFATLDDVLGALLTPTATEEPQWAPELVRASVNLALKESSELSEELDLLEHLATSERVLEILVRDHDFRPSPEEARKAAFLGSERLLRFMLQSSPPEDMQIHGMHIFTRPRSGSTLLRNEESKRCIRVLLTRGAKLGDQKFTPKSKLLSKIEADCFPLWARRWLDSAAMAGLVLPDAIQRIVGEYLGCKV